MYFYSFNQCSEWFYSTGFEIMQHPYVIIVDSYSTPNRNTNVVPAKLRSACTCQKLSTEVFKCSYVYVYFYLCSCLKKKSNADIFNIQLESQNAVKTRYKSHIFSNELSITMISEHNHLWSSNSRIIFDPLLWCIWKDLTSVNTVQKCLVI